MVGGGGWWWVVVVLRAVSVHWHSLFSTPLIHSLFFSVSVTDRFGARSTLDDTTVCSITKDPTEKGDLGIDEGSTQSAQGVVSFDGIRFLGDGDTTYQIRLSCLIDNVIDIAYDKLITIGWCEEGYAPIARICRPCQDRMYSLYGQSCLDCPDGGNCTALERSNDGLPQGVGEPRALPGYWLYTAPKAAARNRCPTGWLDNQGPCNPAEVLMPKSGVCVDRNWPTFQGRVVAATKAIVASAFNVVSYFLIVTDFFFFFFFFLVLFVFFFYPH